MHKSESILENAKKILWDFEIQTDHLTPARRPDLVLINKKNKNLQTSEFFRPRRPQRENQRKRKAWQVLGPRPRTKKAMENEGDDDTDCNCCTWNETQRLGKWTGKLGNQMSNRDNSNYSIIKIGYNTEKDPGDLRRLTVIQTPLKDHQLTQLWKTRKE